MPRIPKYKIQHLPFIVVRDGDPPARERIILDTLDKVLAYWDEHITCCDLYDPSKEMLVVIPITARLTPNGWHIVSIGSLNETVAHPREVLRPCIIEPASGFIVIHNHPSGDPTPSKGDRMMTKRIRDAASIMQISFVDHVIIGAPAPDRDSYFSFQESGKL